MQTPAPRDEMLLLCERLLGAAVADAGASVEAITGLFVTLRARLRGAECACTAHGAHGKDEEMVRILDGLLGHLQFFDEHAQRVQHVAAILALFEHLGPATAREGEPTLPERIRALLSTEREWQVLAEVMADEASKRPDTDRVELF